MTTPHLAILYEHPDWFKPLFSELEGRGIPYVPTFAGELSYDPAVRSFPYPLVLNRMSPSSYLRGHSQGIFFCREFLRYLENVGVRVINGYNAYVLETSKCAQIEIFERLGLPYPLTRMVNHPSQVLEASSVQEGLTEFRASRTRPCQTTNAEKARHEKAMREVRIVPPLSGQMDQRRSIEPEQQHRQRDNLPEGKGVKKRSKGGASGGKLGFHQAPHGIIACGQELS
ncbi:MAG TPA: hypothetical protein VEV41_00625 [Terriglobales bacterium]|nr:hypothetical protein [Terriglobales bacterium]